MCGCMIQGNQLYPPISQQKYWKITESILPHTENKGIVGAIRWSRGKGKAGKLVFVQLSWLSGRALAAQARVRLQVTANLFTFLYFHLITSIVLYIGKGWPFVVTWQIVQCVLLHYIVYVHVLGNVDLPLAITQTCQQLVHLVGGSPC